MGLQTDNLHVEIAAASLNLYPYARRGMPHWGSNFEELVPFLARTMCRNFEIHPTKALLEDAAQRIETGDTAVIEATMGSLHQTFNEGTGVFGKVADLRGVYRGAASIKAMRTLQAALPHPVASVHLPQIPVLRIPHRRSTVGRGYPGSHTVVQPSAEIYRDFGSSNFEYLMLVMAANGVLGACPDTVHARRRAADGYTPPRVEDSWINEFKSGRVFQMHIATDRTDVARRDPKIAATSVQEYKAFTSPSWHIARNTLMGDMIVAAIENWQQPKELARSSTVPVLRQVIEMPPIPQRYLRRTRDHAQMVENLGQIAREAGAKVLLWGSEIPQKPETAVK